MPATSELGAERYPIAIGRKAAWAARQGGTQVYLLRGIFNVSVGLDALAAKLARRGIRSAVYGHGDAFTVSEQAMRDYRAGRNSLTLPSAPPTSTRSAMSKNRPCPTTPGMASSRWASPGGPRAPYGDGSVTAPPVDLQDWDDYVRSVVQRYRGRIESYELWNLPDTSRYYSGSVETLGGGGEGPGQEPLPGPWRVVALSDGRFRGTSPMRYLRRARFERVHQALRAASADDVVTQIAVAHGFTHMGRFSVDYQKQFGESPSATLRRPR